MKVYYASLTGKVRKFIRKSGVEAEPISPTTIATEPFILVTYTIGFGEVPEPVQSFLEANSEYLRGVAVSGNKLWGANYGRAGDLISTKYRVPLLLKFELEGTDADIAIFKERVLS